MYIHIYCVSRFPIRYVHVHVNIMFQGPDWEYSTELPEWAKDDWEDNITQEETTQK